MASVFTYDPDPPRIASPWLSSHGSNVQNNLVDREGTIGNMGVPQPVLLADCGITRLEAEPQEGPTEYKLHLLLRPRRTFSALSTGQYIPGSHQSRPGTPRSLFGLIPKPGRVSPTPTPSLQSRQNRLQNLTTQLLWRLQQSSPHHSSSNVDHVLPNLPEAYIGSGSSLDPGKLLPGLEESRGALYEIGVSDDGTFIGLTKDELEESLTNLRSMAASLGCKVQVLRIVIVGDCEWLQETEAGQGKLPKVYSEKLYVAEALVAPNTYQSRSAASTISNHGNGSTHESRRREARMESSRPPTAQLRVSLTGITTSGKSSLLGVLSTSTSDNGRGKSRLSLLKHRHEIASGITSSVAPEVIGYQSIEPNLTGAREVTQIVNYGLGNISSWIDIHNAAEGGRLVLLTDSAGHPRYRRTTVRGLVSWAPHWTICCVAADDTEDAPSQAGATASAQEVLGLAGAGIDVSGAHLDFCLKLGLSLVVVVTKLDLALKPGLRQTLAKVLSAIKSAGRQPVILTDDKLADPSHRLISAESESDVRKLLARYSDNDIPMLVPIVLTSAVTGRGIGTLHALLRHLPLPLPPQVLKDSFVAQEGITPASIFNIDEVFTKAEGSSLAQSNGDELYIESSYVLSGYLQYGEILLGDEIDIGPFTPEALGDDVRQVETYHASSFPRQLSNSPALANTQLRASPRWSTDSKAHILRDSSLLGARWHRVRIVSIRNLRLPVRKLLPDQVGTIGIMPINAKLPIPHSSSQKIRKGMVLAKPPVGTVNGTLPSYSGFRALFHDDAVLELVPGALVVVYIASIRTSARVVGVSASPPQQRESQAEARSVEDGFGLDDSGSGNGSDGGGGVELPTTNARPSARGPDEVAFQFLTYREWIEVGTQVLVMPGGTSPGCADRTERASVGLEGFVGKIAHGFV
ncbi:MAG: hypothetical protein Q9187_006441 [Circinaria calcarea]